ncbi:M20/M25/M40 family metallo-hydrolase [Janibacter cremeus]|uniref:Acetylornithine deacetylase/succinyl-diaminopimelate desuccinylase-like protein n=1 Tax=Janibacter cremeus TaxID=1285192 RepID=A0A852VYI0_9MICO|nr:M20/M25/M40 family metallo-hydrolase [Janibacter cremeus]NYF99703.1 acetylornithine deacetylase/succinyl-diaminopimelate desuccinylase-like protein [Janibacter cremeus]
MSEIPPQAGGAPTAPEQEVVDICRELLQIDTSNYGPGQDGPGEREAADYVVGLLREVGLEPQVFESQERRTTVSVRIPGADRDRGALCIHGHLDVVPAHAEDWTHPPFDAVEADGCLWGRGAVDMKDMVAMMLASVRHLARTGTVPPRDLLFVFFADEEAGGVLGSQFMVREHPEVFEGVTEAISEVGGYSVTVEDAKGDPRRAYLLQTAEKGIAWLHLRAKGTAGHGSVPTSDNPIVHLAEAIARIDAHKWPREFIASVRGLLDGLSEVTGVGYSDEDAEELLERIGTAAGFVRGALQDTANITMLDAGYKHNVIPQDATAALDCRFLPGHQDDLMATIRELAGEHVDVEIGHMDTSLESPFEGALVERMKSALLAEDPGVAILPYCLSGGTDNKALSTIGVTGYGFAPLRLPADLDFAPMFHGIDERVPLESLEFGARVLWRLIEDC